MTDHTILIASLNHYFALATLIGFAVLLIWIVDLLFASFWMPVWKKKMYVIFENYALPIGFFVSFFATIVSLYYQFYLHIAPCDLCWFQRVFIYPLMFLFGFAWWKNDRTVYDYVMGLSVFGFVIALYHHYLQLGYNLYKPCSSALFAVDCAKPTFIEYGFITYPFMAVVTLALTFLIAYSAKKSATKA